MVKSCLTTEDWTRVKAVIKTLSLADKINIIRGDDEPHDVDQGAAGYLPGVPSKGIASLRLADGPPGILTREPSPAPPCTMGLAATFDSDLAYRNGKLIGKEAVRLGVDVALEPFVNILRDYRFRRGWNTFGEDPIVNGILGASQIKGIQDEGVMAQVKHYVCFDSTGYDVEVDEQTLREVYVAPFADAVEAGVSSVMASYNKVNGEFACGNDHILQKILREELGFEGFTTTDWGGMHAADYIQKGMDMEMPGKLHPGAPFLTMMRSYFDDDPNPVEPLIYDPSVLQQIFERSMPEETPLPGEPVEKRPNQMAGQFPDDPHPENLYSLLKDGRVSESDIDVAVERILGQMQRFGYLDKPGKQPTGEPISADVDDILLTTAEKSATLLKNDGILPLKGNPTIALIGPGAGQTVSLGINAEHALGIIEKQISPLDALSSQLPEANIRLSVANDMTGTTIPARNWKDGVHVSSAGGEPLSKGTEINYTIANGNPLPANTEVQIKGDLVIEEDGLYGINLQMLGASASLSIDGQPVSHTSSVVGGRHGDTVQPGQDNILPTTDGLNNVRRYVSLQKGIHEVVVKTVSDTSGHPIQVRLNWTTEGGRKQAIRDSVESAKNADIAIVFAWARLVPKYILPDHQDELIQQVAKVNSNTIVVLNTSLPSSLPWINDVRAVLQMWWSGDEGGPAPANILTGKVSPAGRLPFTWGQKAEDYPASDPRFPERGSNLDGIVKYSEGLDIGYRWFDKEQIQPLFAFGHGLTYTSFSYKSLSVSEKEDSFIVSFSVENTGTYASDEVSQVYLSAPHEAPSDGKFCKKTLVAFSRIFLNPGESKKVEVSVPLRRFQYWSCSKNTWVPLKSGRKIFVGASASDLKLETEI